MTRNEARELMGFKRLKQLAHFLGIGGSALSDWDADQIPARHELTIRKHLEAQKEAQKGKRK